MATKKDKKEKQVITADFGFTSAAAPQVAEEDRICIKCKFLKTGDWRGPTCMNPASSFYRKHMADYGTCSEFSPKGRPPVVAAKDEGLYDPEPITRQEPVVKDTLRDMLEKETTPSDE